MTATTASQPQTRTRAPYGRCALIGLGGLFAGVTGPLLSTFVPPLVRDSLGDSSTAVGSALAIDNVLLLLLVPWAGAASDRARARGNGRLGLVLLGFALAAIAMAVLPVSSTAGTVGLLASMVALYSGINLARTPLQALVADLVPVHHRSLATGSITFQMCVAAVVFLMLGETFGMRPAFLAAAAVIVVIGVVLVVGIRGKDADALPSAVGGSEGSVLEAARTALSGAVPGMRAVFVACLLLQLTFQTFTSWFSLHAIDRFDVSVEDVAIGFIAWAMGGVVGALPAGHLGRRVGHRNAMLGGFVVLACCALALDRVSNLSQAAILLAIASAAWAFPTVNSYPLFARSVAEGQRGVLTALFLLSVALGGMIGDPLNGLLFDLVGSYRPLFLFMAAYCALALVAVLRIPVNSGRAPTPLHRP